MYVDGDGYKHFVIEKQFYGHQVNLIEEIVEAFVNEGIGQSELGEFYNIAGIVKTEEYGDFVFNEARTPSAYVKIETDGILKEEIIRDLVITGLIDLRRIKYKKPYIHSTIKATYTLGYS